MPKILTKDHFSIADLKQLYNSVVINPFNDPHSSSNNEYDISYFFVNGVKPYFQSMLSTYAGDNTINKAFTIIKEIRGEILNKILFSLDDSLITNELAVINNNLKSNMKDLIRNNRTNLQQMQLNCQFCATFREYINQILGPNTTATNPLNANSLLGAWRALDPENNRRGGYNGYIKNIFSYNQTGELLSCNTQLQDGRCGSLVVEAIAVYYLATKISCAGLMLNPDEQENRFGIFITTLTECLRGYNEGNHRGIDYPSCAPGIIGRLVRQGGYESKIQFISKKSFINRIINDVVCKRINEFLQQVDNATVVANLLASLITGFGDDQKITALAANQELLKQRYSVFSAIDNNYIFFQLIKEHIKQEKDTHHSPIMVAIYDEIQRYNYQSFIDAFTRLDLVNFNEIFDESRISKELQLIAYAFSDPAYNCHAQVANMCAAKLRQLQPLLNNECISVDTAKIICQTILAEILPIIRPQSLFVSGFNQVDLIIIIESYKNGSNSMESDEEFIARIIKKSYLDRDELGEEQSIDGLDNIINQLLINRSNLIDRIASLILIKIKQTLLSNQQSNANDQAAGNHSSGSNAFPQGYTSTTEASLGEVVSQRLQHVPIRVSRDLNRLRYISTGIRNTTFTGPYSNLVDLPDVPVIHPYFPNGINANQLYDNGIPSFPIVVSIPKGTIGNLPSGVTEQLVRNNININQLDVFFCVQNMPWNDTEQLLFRPHPWLHSDAPFSGNYSKQEVVLAAIMAVNANLSTLIEFQVGTNHSNNNEVIYSPNSMRIQGINNLTHSSSFYSFCFARNSSRAVLTLHWLLNQQDHFRLNQFISQLHNSNATLQLQEIIDWANNLSNSKLNSGIGLLSGAGLEITAVDALQYLIVGGQPEIRVNNTQYSLSEQQLAGVEWRREVFFSNVNQLTPEEQEEQRLLALPLSQQPVAFRFKMASRYLR
jgi:hypothetical protein